MIILAACICVTIITIVVILVRKRNIAQTENQMTQSVSVSGNEDASAGIGMNNGNEEENGKGNLQMEYGLLEYDGEMTTGYLNNCIFLGDSRSVAMVMYGFMPQEQVLAQVGLTHGVAMSTVYQFDNGREYTFENYLLSHQAPVIYICYGVNGMSANLTDDYKNAYRRLVEEVKRLCPDSAIVIQSIWPVEDDGIYQMTAQNAWINKCNDFLLELALDEQVYYLDVNSILLDEDGTMKNEFNSGDGLHYAAYAYPFILEYIVSHPVPGISATGWFEIDYSYARPSGNYAHYNPDTEQTVSDNTISDNCVSGNSVSDNSVSENAAEPGDGNQSPSPSSTPSPSATPSPSSTPSPSATPSPSSTPSPSATPSPSSTPSPGDSSPTSDPSTDATQPAGET
ncbi:MAG: SGNH/GDSL hydrolase family protein [Lachnospiraceae bacterium]